MVVLLPVIPRNATQEVVVPRNLERTLIVRLALVIVVTVSVLTSSLGLLSVKL
jgi:hypothetical protein